MLDHDYYTYRVTWSAEDNEYVGLCSEFPSLSWLSEIRIRRFKGFGSWSLKWLQICRVTTKKFQNLCQPKGIAASL